MINFRQNNDVRQIVYLNKLKNQQTKEINLLFTMRVRVRMISSSRQGFKISL